MSKAETYCYVNRKQLENKRARVCLYYSNQHPNSEERIEVRRTGDLKNDLQTLSKLVQNELLGSRKAKIEKEKETIVYNSYKTTINKYFICVQ